MSAINLAPAFSFFSALNATPLRPLHTLVRTTEERFRPAQVASFVPREARAQAVVLARADGAGAERATIRRESGAGRVPTIVLGGLVPDATEQVFLLRRSLLRSGDVYYVNYPNKTFSLDLICAQLSDLVAELAAAGQPPVMFAVSFGAGLVLEWLRRARLAREETPLAGVVLVSPVACAADLVAPGAPKPTTLLGRALKPFMDADTAPSEATVEKARAVFLRMFEAGAQNKAALRSLMTAAEAERLKGAVLATIRNITPLGARQRVGALANMAAPTDYFLPHVLPLTTAPTLILFAEREDAVLVTEAPVRFALERAAQAYFSHAAVQTVAACKGEAPVQHASLVFHVFEFLPPLQAFYQAVRRRPFAAAA